MRNVLITGENSYIGNSFAEWIAENNVSEMHVTKTSLRNDTWRQEDWSEYDTVLHVAGLAHVDVNHADEETKKKYYRINCDLTIEVAQKAKQAGVNQFLYMSSVIVYGDSAPIGKEKLITQTTKPCPSNFYGDSKLQAEKGLENLESDTFKIAIIRSPMVYGPNSKGNFPLLRKVALKTPIFPNISNTRSMIYIYNLCELLRFIIQEKQSGIFCPQNKGTISTSELVRLIAKSNARRIRLIGGMEPVLKLLSHMTGYVNKVFGSLSYDEKQFEYFGGQYCVYSWSESIEDLEKRTLQPFIKDKAIKKNRAIKVSIVTPCFNSEQTIRDTIESILKQEYNSIEYIIVDGGSEDHTVEVAESYRQKLEEKGYVFKIISEPDHGIYDAMNKGVRLAKGEIIGIINSDDFYEPQAVLRMVDTYEKEHFDMFYADLRILIEDGNGIWVEKMIKHSRLRKLAVSRDWNHPTTFITAKTYQRFHYKQESLHDDWDLVLRIRKAGLKVAVLNEVLANFRMGGASNEKDLKKCIARGKARYKIYRDNGYSRLYLLECIAIEAVKWIAI